MLDYEIAQKIYTQLKLAQHASLPYQIKQTSCCFKYNITNYLATPLGRECQSI